MEPLDAHKPYSQDLEAAGVYDPAQPVSLSDGDPKRRPSPTRVFLYWLQLRLPTHRDDPHVCLHYPASVVFPDLPGICFSLQLKRDTVNLEDISDSERHGTWCQPAGKTGIDHAEIPPSCSPPEEGYSTCRLDVSIPHPLTKFPTESTPLHLVVDQTKFQVDVVRSLLKLGTDADAEDNGGRTPLQIASGLGHFEVIQLLLTIVTGEVRRQHLKFECRTQTSLPIPPLLIRSFVAWYKYGLLLVPLCTFVKYIVIEVVFSIHACTRECHGY